MKDLYIVTGTTSGLGNKLMEKLATIKEVDLHCFNRRPLEKEIANVTNHQVDISKQEVLQSTLESLNLDQYRNIHVILNAAVVKDDFIGKEFDLSSYKESVETNAWGSLNFVAAIKKFRPKGVYYVLLGSTSNLFPKYGQLSYYLSKHIIHTFYQSITRRDHDNFYKLIYLGPMLTRATENNKMNPFKKIAFDLLVLSTDYVSNLILTSLSRNQSETIYPKKSVFLLYKVTSFLRAIFLY